LKKLELSNRSFVGPGSHLGGGVEYPATIPTVVDESSLPHTSRHRYVPFALSKMTDSSYT
jgi:hypothetical protein